jgi:putative Mn2+ efflux pump MntP
MTLAGLFAGRGLAATVEAPGPDVAAAVERLSRCAAAGVLWLVGAHMLFEAARHLPAARRAGVPGSPSSEACGAGARESGRGLALVWLAVATSLDAFGVGTAWAFMGSAVWLAAGVIGLVAAALSGLGVVIACRVRSALGRASPTWAEVTGAFVIAGTGVRVALA